MRKAGAWLLGFALVVTLAIPAQAAEWQSYLEEDFSSPQTMFYTGQAGEAIYSIDELGRYVIDGINTGSDSLSSLTDNLYYYYVEAQCEVDKTIAGEQAFTGVVFHYNKSIPGKLSYYVFYVFGDGYYGAKRVIGDQVDIIIPLTPTDQLDLYGVNVLAVDAQGTSFDLYLNGRFIDGFTDVRIDGGGFGFYVSKHARAAFDNFKVKVERRGGREDLMQPVVTSNVADEGGTAADDGFHDYQFPVIPKDPNRPTYSWEVGVDKTGKANQNAEETVEPGLEVESAPVADETPQPQPAPAAVTPRAAETDGAEILRPMQLPPGEELIDLPPESELGTISGDVEDWRAETTTVQSTLVQNEGVAQDITPVHAAEDNLLSTATRPGPAREQSQPDPEVPNTGASEAPLAVRETAEVPPESAPATADAAVEPTAEAAAPEETPAPAVPRIEHTDAKPGEELSLFPAEMAESAADPAYAEEPHADGESEQSEAAQPAANSEEAEAGAPSAEIEEPLVALDELPLEEPVAEAQTDAAADSEALPEVESAADGELRFASVDPKVEDMGVGRIVNDATPISELDWQPLPEEPASEAAPVEPAKADPAPVLPQAEAAAEYYSGENLVVIADDFSAQHWPVSTDGTETYRYFSGAYEINNLNAETMAISFQESTLADSEFAVEIEFLDGVGHVGYGIASRLGIVNGVVSYYGLFICQNGELMLLKVKGGEEQVLVNWQPSELIRTSQPNRIALDVRGGLLYAYINGELAATISDAGITSGGYALLAGPGVAVRFDNLRIHGFTP